MTNEETIAAILQEAVLVKKSCEKVALLLYNHALMPAEDGEEISLVEVGLYGLGLACPKIKKAIINNSVAL